MDVLKIVDTVPEDTSKIYFGAYVTLERDDGSTITYRIVGPDEFDLKAHKISLDAPLAKALLGKTLDDEIRLTLADKVDIYYVVDVRYGPLSE
jgi:transcription elongation factor GreB